jgi:hypothetical protein
MDIHIESGGTSLQLTGVWSGGQFPLYAPPGELTLAVTPAQGGCGRRQLR